VPILVKIDQEMRPWECPQYRDWSCNSGYTTIAKKSKVKVTAWRNVSAVKRYKSGTDRLTDFKLGENYYSEERNMRQTFMYW